MTLSACSTVSDSFRGSAEHTKAANTPAGECKRVYQPTRDPGFAEGQDARKVIVRYKGALALSNKRGAEAARCDDTAADRAAR